MRVHESDYHVMRGSGIGSIFSNIFRGLVPIAKSLFSIGKKAVMSKTGQQVMKAAKRTAMDAGLDIVNDVLDGQNLEAVAKKTLRQSGDNMLRNVKKEMSGGRRGKKRRKKKRVASTKPRSRSRQKKKKKCVKKKRAPVRQGRVTKKKSKPRKGKKKKVTGLGKRQSAASIMRMWM